MTKNDKECFHRFLYKNIINKKKLDSPQYFAYLLEYYTIVNNIVWEGVQNQVWSFQQLPKHVVMKEDNHRHMKRS